MSKRTLTSGQRIQNARDISSVAYHNELSKVVREAFKNLPDAEVRRLVNLCSIGRSCIVEAPLSENFKKEYVYDINNVISMSPLFKSIQSIGLHGFGFMVIFENFYQKIIRYIVPRSSRSTHPAIFWRGFLLTFFIFYVIIVMF